MSSAALVVASVGHIGPAPDAAFGAGAAISIAVIIAAGAIAFAATATHEHITSGEYTKTIGQSIKVIWLAAMVIAAVSIGAALAFCLPAIHAAGTARSAWAAQVADWAKATYDVTDGADTLEYRVRCPDGTSCYSGTVLVGGKLETVTLVILGTTPVLVGGDKALLHAKELARVAW